VLIKNLVDKLLSFGIKNKRFDSFKFHFFKYDFEFIHEIVF